jgi:hypothetical protein
LGIALACVPLSFLMMITRAKAVPQVIGFGDGERFFAATSATYGMPMVVEPARAGRLIGVLILGVFMFQIREQLTARHSQPRKAQGGLNWCPGLLSPPACRRPALALVGHRDNARDVNVAQPGHLHRGLCADGADYRRRPDAGVGPRVLHRC